MKCASNFSIDSLENLKAYFHVEDKEPKFRQCLAVRIPKKLATFILQNNSTMIINGEVRYFTLSNIGLGVYQVELNGLDMTEYVTTEGIK